MIIRKIFLVCFLAFILCSSFRLPDDEPINYYGIPVSLTFNKLDYKLSWSSHPNNVYYKQEYIPKGNSADTFKDMVLIDFIETDADLKDAVKVQVAKIQERKKTDAVCNYDIVESPDGKEFVLDFLMSDRKDNKLTVLEWSAYHYKTYTDKAGHKGVLLFGICHRAYGDESNDMLKNLSKFRADNRNALIAYPIPDIQIK